MEIQSCEVCVELGPRKRQKEVDNVVRVRVLEVKIETDVFNITGQVDNAQQSADT